MTRISRAFIGIAVAAILLITWLLYVRQPPRPEAPIEGSSAAPTRGGQLTVSFRTEPRSFNRYIANDAASELVARLTQDRLVRINRVTGEVEPRLAESWTEDAEGRSYTVKLRSGVRFSDGAPLTSADVLFSFEAAYHAEGSRLAGDLKVGGQPLAVSATDDLTVAIRFPSTFAPGLRILDSLPILPRHKLGPALAEGRFHEAWNSKTAPSELAGLGPFVLTEYAPGQRLVFARNPNFRVKDASGTQLPYLDRLLVEIVPDQNAEVLRLQAGQTDLTTSEVRPEDIAALRRDGQAGRVQLLEVGVGLNINALWFNLRPEAKAKDPRRAWLQSEALRKAISHAIDRDRFVNTVYLGAAAAIYGPVSPGNRLWYAADAPTYPHDLARARELLAQLGLADTDGDGMLEDAAGAPVRFAILTQQGQTLRERGAAVIQEQLRQIGITADIVKLDPPSLGKRFGEGDYDAMFFGFEVTDFEPAANLQFWLSSGDFHLWHPNQPKPATAWEARIDELIARQVTAMDLGERQRLFSEAQRVFGAHAPALYFAAPKIFVAMSPRVAGATPAVLNPQVLWNAEILAVRQPVAR